MPSFTESSLRLLKRLLGTRSRTIGTDLGTAAVLDGSSAVALTEAAISQAAGLGATTPTDIAAITWRAEQRRRDDDSRQSRLTTLVAEGPRGGLASAAGLCLSGMRATAFVSGQEAASLQEMLADIAGRHLPLVVHIDNRATGGSSTAPGSGHEAIHLSAQSGCFQLIAANVQEAVDFTLVARKVAEQTLLPGLVFMDHEQTAAALQQVVLPSRQLIEDYLGWPDDLVPATTPAEKLLFGGERRRIPCWHDTDRPVLLGSAQPAGIWGLGRAASRLLLAQPLAKTVTDSLELFARQSGRRHVPISGHRVNDAELLLVAMGAAIETAEAVADQLRSTRKLKVGVLGVRSLQPFPAESIVQQLGKARCVCVLERLDAPHTADAPLLTGLRAVIDQQAAHHPRLLSVLYGLGGLPLHAADLAELCVQAEKIQQRQLYLGIAFDQTAASHPKRQVLLDRLRRSYPELADRGLSGDREIAPDLAPEEAIALAVHHISGSGGAALAQEAADTLWRAAGGELRSRLAHSAAPWGDSCTDWISWAPRNLRDPGDRLPVDLAIVATDLIESAAPDLQLNDHGSLLIESTAPDNHRIPLATMEQLRQRSGQLYSIDSRMRDTDADLRNERMLGAALAILLERELLEISFRRLLSIRETALSDLPEDSRVPRLQAFKEGFEQVTKVDMASLIPSPADAFAGAEPAPPELKRLGNVDDNYDSLPRFWDQTGVLYRDRMEQRITPDPFLAVNAIPPFSAAFRKFDRLRETLPVLDAEACTGCGACWTLCPDGAIGVSVMDTAMLLETGVRMTGADRLRPMLSKLSISMIKRCREKGAAPTTAGALLNDTFDWLLQQSLPENQKQQAAAAKGKLIEALGELQLSLTDPLFRTPESQTPGSGNLLLLAVDPDTCKGCGICASSCEPNALALEQQTTALLAGARRSWQIWEQLPDTTEATRERAAGQIPLGKPAAMLMSQRFRSTLSGGDGAEPGSGARLALRLALAAVESKQRPLLTAYCEEVNGVRERLSSLIRKMLADALPADDLDTLATGLERVDGRATDLTTFINESTDAIDSRIDALRLRRLVGLAQKLRDLSWRLSEGRQGFGRAALGLVLSSDLPSGWAGVFPDNPFGIPVTVDGSGDAAQFGAGLLQGQLRQAIEGFVLMRKARLELESPADAARQWSSLDHLGWEELEAEERALCPPVFIIGSSSLLAGRGLAQLSAIMAGKLPLKILLFAELDLGVAAAADGSLPLAAVEDPGLNLALLTLSRRNTLNAQCSIAYPDHLLTALESAVNFSGPALIQLHAPSPGRHGFATDQTIRQARLAVESRTFPLFLYDPEAEGVFGSRFSLTGNPEPGCDWLTGDSGKPLTTAAWALGERRFNQCFTPLQSDAAEALPLDEYLALARENRAGRTPFVPVKSGDRDAFRQRVKEPLVQVCEERLQAWRTLQEVAGLVTPFTQRIEQQAQQAVAAAHQAELEQMQSSYEARIRELKQELLEQSRAEIKARLMAMAGYGLSDEESQRARH